MVLKSNCILDDDFGHTRKFQSSTEKIHFFHTSEFIRTRHDIATPTPGSTHRINRKLPFRISCHLEEFPISTIFQLWVVFFKMEWHEFNHVRDDSITQLSAHSPAIDTIPTDGTCVVAEEMVTGEEARMLYDFLMNPPDDPQRDRLIEEALKEFPNPEEPTELDIDL